MQNRHKLILLITLLLLAGFFTVSYLMYRASKASIRDSIIVNELPLTADSISAQIQKDLVKSVNVSGMMAANTFVKDWVLAGEKNEQLIKQYLLEAKQQNNALGSFFISEKTRNYYSSDAPTKKVLENVQADAWYFKTRSAGKLYNIAIERDKRYKNRLAIFVDYSVYDNKKQFLGFTGIAVQYDAAKNILENYEKHFNRKVYFVDTAGEIVLANDVARPVGSNISQILGIKPLQLDVSSPKISTFSYQLKNKRGCSRLAQNS